MDNQPMLEFCSGEERMRAKAARAFKDLASLRLSKTLIVGGLATLSDLFVLIFLVRVAHLKPQFANIPSLLIGSAVQFFGNRNFVFRSGRGRLGIQVPSFALAEFGAFTLNAFGYYAFVTWLKVNYVVAKPVVTAIVFFCFSYQIWKVIFWNRSGHAR